MAAQLVADLERPLEVERVPARQPPSVVQASVSAEASTANQPGPLVDHGQAAPEQPIEAPSAIGPVS